MRIGEGAYITSFFREFWFTQNHVQSLQWARISENPPTIIRMCGSRRTPSAGRVEMDGCTLRVLSQIFFSQCHGDGSFPSKVLQECQRSLASGSNRSSTKNSSVFTAATPQGLNVRGAQSHSHYTWNTD
ncbi:hypothetical protein M378DRAFT_855979 [Amanita muscaria Koide BX008]|uniref:Uncharacterized protein n=1 Tax=Amanita muscaria (strain Koide BX008) TaxID=946122 RepID=A0A0C2WIW2_AMAMK|nr:hypothetical protein M378DRAFT_855979 [Amanita muscaria Koide BX008]